MIGISRMQPQFIVLKEAQVRYCARALFNDV